MEDEMILQLYFERSEDAIKETRNKYGRYCRYISYRILGSDEDAEETENDVYLKIWNAIPPEHPEPFKAYIGMLTRRTALDKYDAATAQKRGGGEPTLIFDELEDCISANDGNPGDEIALRDALNAFLAKLPEKQRNIFLRRYWYMSSVNEIAEDFSVSESAVKVILFRARKKLKRCLEKEGFSV